MCVRTHHFLEDHRKSQMQDSGFFNIVMYSVSVANSQRLVWYCVRWYIVNTHRLHWQCCCAAKRSSICQLNWASYLLSVADLSVCEQTAKDLDRQMTEKGLRRQAPASALGRTPAASSHSASISSCLSASGAATHLFTLRQPSLQPRELEISFYSLKNTASI